MSTAIYKDFYLQNLFTDFTLQAMDENSSVQINVHRIILSSVSEFFESYFKETFDIQPIKVNNIHIFKSVIDLIYDVVTHPEESSETLQLLSLLDFLRLPYSFDEKLRNLSVNPSQFAQYVGVIEQIQGLDEDNLQYIADKFTVDTPLTNFSDDFLFHLNNALFKPLVVYHDLYNIFILNLYTNKSTFFYVNDKIKTIYPSPDGRQIAALHSQKVSIYNLDGTVAQEINIIDDAYQLLWLIDIYIIYLNTVYRYLYRENIIKPFIDNYYDRLVFSRDGEFCAWQVDKKHIIIRNPLQEITLNIENIISMQWLPDNQLSVSLPTEILFINGDGQIIERRSIPTTCILFQWSFNAECTAYIDINHQCTITYPSEVLNLDEYIDDILWDSRSLTIALYHQNYNSIIIDQGKVISRIKSKNRVFFLSRRSLNVYISNYFSKAS